MTVKSLYIAFFVVATMGLFPVALGSAAFSQKAQPAAPAAGQSFPEMATPKGTLALFTESIRQADGAKMRACLHAVTPVEIKMADSTTEVATALSRLRQAAVTKFGDAGGATFQSTVPTEADVKRIQAADEKITGETAVVEVTGGPGGPVKMKMVKAGGVWKISVAHMVAGQWPDQIDAQLKSSAATVKLVNETIGEINSGKHKTDKEAYAALQAKMKAAFPEKPTPQRKPTGK